MNCFAEDYNYKKRAGINKPGGAHVLFRHTPASIMVLNGCDLLTIQHVMRHNDIKTTMRYLHLADEAKRERYDQFLKLWMLDYFIPALGPTIYIL
jgi:integrase/recombinase XerD